MLSKNLFLMVFMCVVLLGCSSKPNVSDIKPQLQKNWSCQGLKIVNLKKDNGIDNGNSYDMDVSYQVEVEKDFSELNSLDCSSMIAYRFLSVGEKNALVFPLKKGDLISIKDTYTMVKSENGWLSKKCSYCWNQNM